MNSKKIILTLAVLLFLAWSSYHLSRFATADFHARAGKRSLDAGDYDTAQANLVTSIQYDSKNPRFHYTLAQSFYAQARETKGNKTRLDSLQRAKKAYQRSTDLNPLEGKYWLGLAKSSWWLSRFRGHEEEGRRVESFYGRALETDPNNPLFLYTMANYYMVSGETERSFEYVRRLAMVYPNINELRKHPYWSDGMEDQFILGLQAATDNVLVGEQALRLLASIAVQKKDWAQAVAYTEKIVQNSKKQISPSQYVNLGRYYLKIADYEKAKQTYLRGIKLSDNRIQVLENILNHFRNPGPMDLYAQICQETAAFDATVRKNVELILGKGYFYSKDFDTAVEHLQRSLQERETPEAHRYLAEIAMKKKEWDTAELESQRATVLEPQNSQAHLLFVRSLQAQKKYRSALEAITQAIRDVRSPRHDFYNIQAQLQWKLKDYHAAIQAWEAAQKIVPQNPNYPRQIARAYKMLDDFSSAERYYLAALQLKPEDKGLKRELEEVRKISKQRTVNSKR